MSGSVTVGGGWRDTAGGFGLGLLLTAWPLLLDAFVGTQSAVRSAALSLGLVAVALGSFVARSGGGGRPAALTGPLAAAGALAGALLWRGGQSAASASLAAAIAILPAAVAIGATLPNRLRSSAWLAGIGAGIALGAATRPQLGLPLMVVIAALALCAGDLRRAPAARAGATRDGDILATVAIAIVGSALVVTGTRLATEVSHGGAGAVRAAVAASGLALLLASAIPLRGAPRAAMLAAAAGAWWLAAVLVRDVEPTLAAIPGPASSVWLAAVGLVALPSALTARGVTGLARAAPAALSAALIGVAFGLPLVEHALLPAAGPRAAGVTLALLLLAAALGAASRAGRDGVRSASLLAGAALVALAALVIGAVWRPQPLATDAHPLAQRHGPRVTGTLWEHDRDPALRWLTVNGLTIGQSYGGIDTVQQLLAHLPFALRPAAPPRRMLVIGHGLGVIGEESLRHESVDELVAIEPVEALIGLDDARTPAPDGREPTIVRADPWIWVRGQRDAPAFDVVIVAGQLLEPEVDDDRLWTREFYRRCGELAGDEGLVLRPLPLDLDEGRLAVALRTFLLEFPHVQAWLSPPTHAILVGSSSTTTLDPAATDRLMREPAARNLRRYGWRDGATTISLLTADESRLERIAGSARPHTMLRRTLAGFAAPDEDARRINRASALSRLADVRPQLPDWAGLAGYDVPAVEAHHLAATRMIEMFAVLGERRVDAVEPALDALREALRQAPSHGLAAGAFDAMLPLAVELAPDRAGVRTALAERLITAGRAQEAEGELREALRLDPRRGAAFALLGRALAIQGNYHGAVSQLDNAIAFGADSPRTRFELAVALRLSGARERAAAAIEELLAGTPDDPAVLEQRALLLLGGDGSGPAELRQALADARLAVRAGGGRQPGVLHTLALALEATGERVAAIETAGRALEIARSIGARGLEPQLRATLARLRDGTEPALGN